MKEKKEYSFGGCCSTDTIRTLIYKAEELEKQKYKLKTPKPGKSL